MSNGGVSLLWDIGNLMVPISLVLLAKGVDYLAVWRKRKDDENRGAALSSGGGGEKKVVKKKVEGKKEKDDKKTR